MHLDMLINCAADEQEWNAVIRFLALSALDLRELFLNIRQSLKWMKFGQTSSFYINPAHSQPGFLEALPDLKELPLKTLDLTFLDCRHTASHFGSTRLEYDWSHEEKMEWAGRMKRAIMGLN